jgi:Ohr subfamily peroxiredoxin
MNVLYTAEAVALGEGRQGEIRSSDGVLDELVAIPKELGGPGGGTNPEQLFAAGYAACFHSALRLAARQAKIEVGLTEVNAKVGLGKYDDKPGMHLKVELIARVPGVDQAVAEQLVHAAHQLCPYSNATRGNIEVAVTATV